MPKFKESVDLRDRQVEITESVGQVDFDNLQREVSEAGATAIWYGILAAKANTLHEQAKLRVDIVKAQLSGKTRAAALALDKKATERSIEEAVLLDPEYKIVMDEMIKAEESMWILRAARTAAEQKHRNLDNLAGMLHQELGAARSGLAERMKGDLEKDSGRQPAFRQPVKD